MALALNDEQRFLKQTAAEFFAQQAPTGKPLPIALAMVTTSGTTPECWKPNHSPVRP